MARSTSETGSGISSSLICIGVEPSLACARPRDHYVRPPTSASPGAQRRRPRLGDLLLHFDASPDFLANMRLAFVPFMVRSERSPDHRTTGITGASGAPAPGPRLPAP